MTSAIKMSFGHTPNVMSLFVTIGNLIKILHILMYRLQAFPYFYISVPKACRKVSSI